MPSSGARGASWSRGLGKVFDAEGTLADEKVGERLQAFMEGIVRFARVPSQRG